MKKNTNIKDCWLYNLTKHYDKRGFFTEIFSLANLPVSSPPLQINCSFSNKNVVRGIHIAPFYKVVTCVQGMIYDVCVDMREDSPTYLQYTSCYLSEEQMSCFHIPAYCGHGFLALKDSLIVYAQDGLYDPSKERTVYFQDSKLNIYWPQTEEYILSEKDKK